VNNVKLLFGENRPEYWLSFISTLIDLKTLVQIKLTGTLIRHANTYMLADIANMLQGTCNLSSLDICYDFFSRKSRLTADDICSVTPSHVKHLAVSIKNFTEAQNVVKRLKHLLSANFYFDFISTWDRNIEWLAQGTQGSSCQIDGFSLRVWRGRSIIQPSNVTGGSKRIKLNNDPCDLVTTVLLPI
jgi:hypothetical protein